MVLQSRTPQPLYHHLHVQWFQVLIKTIPVNYGIKQGAKLAKPIKSLQLVISCTLEQDL